MIMKYQEAYQKFSEAYKDRYTIEFPTIFSMADFRSKSVLEISSVKNAYFKNALRKFKGKYRKVSYKKGKLKFADNSFDIVFSRWTTQSVGNLELFIKEACRVGKTVIIILPSEQGDQTKMLGIRYRSKYKYRRLRIIKIRKWMKESGMKTAERKKLLRFVYPDLETAFNVMSAMEFENKLNSKEKERIERFLLRRKKHNGIHFTQGAASVCGYK